MKEVFERGNIAIADLNYMNTNITSLQQGFRPVIIVSNEKCNRYSPVVTVIPLTSNLKKTNLPTHVYISKNLGTKVESVALCEQQQSIDKERLKYIIGNCDNLTMRNINKAMLTQLDLNIEYENTFAYG